MNIKDDGILQSSHHGSKLDVILSHVPSVLYSQGAGDMVSKNTITQTQHKVVVTLIATFKTTITATIFIVAMGWVTVRVYLDTQIIVGQN